MNHTDHCGKPVIGMTVMGERGQLVIPKDIRSAMSLEPGTQLMAMLHEGNKLMLIPADQFKEFIAMVTSQFDQIKSAINEKGD
ncbi:AbrB/MazE/SpoVT family DNA-binding domain-containing protein [Patescibacteria group bacterium]|jgi:AbrB family looped-hinge helix DNA binding protein|nr:AbrB/MazE/SpoVT family DNA-binding domain-containing protein [Patescibacteria group bacterium]